MADVFTNALFSIIGIDMDAEEKLVITIALLEKGAVPNFRDENDRTPLHEAARKGQTEIVRVLLEKGADPNVQDGNGSTPLRWALMHDHRDVVNLFRQHEAQVQAST